MPSDHTSVPRFEVVVVGGGVAGLEAALALEQLAGDLVSTTVIAPDSEFVYRPMVVREPFAYSAARRYPLERILRDAGAVWRRDSFNWLDPADRVVHTADGAELRYDALVLAVGAHRYDRFPHALTLDDSRLDEQLHGLVQDVEGGYVHSLAFVAPSRVTWPLPLYELALMMATRAYDMNISMSVTIATPEEEPLAVFGSAVSIRVRRVLEEHGILFLGSAHCEVHQPGRVQIHPGSRELHVDRMVALPELCGPSLPGVPCDASDRFVEVDEHCKVRGLERVFAAGDATAFPVKHGGIAAQQADTAAESIAALAGAPVECSRFTPTVCGILLGAERPLYMRAHLTGGHGSASEISGTPLWTPPAKIAAKYLAPYLDALDLDAAAVG